MTPPPPSMKLRFMILGENQFHHLEGVKLKEVVG